MAASSALPRQGSDGWPAQRHGIGELPAVDAAGHDHVGEQEVESRAVVELCQRRSAVGCRQGFVTEAVQEKLGAHSSSGDKPWMKTFGKLRHLRRETARINQLIGGRI